MPIDQEKSIKTRNCLKCTYIREPELIDINMLI